MTSPTADDACSGEQPALERLIAALPVQTLSDGLTLILRELHRCDPRFVGLAVPTESERFTFGVEIDPDNQTSQRPRTSLIPSRGDSTTDLHHHWRTEPDRDGETALSIDQIVLVETRATPIAIGLRSEGHPPPESSLDFVSQLSPLLMQFRSGLPVGGGYHVPSPDRLEALAEFCAGAGHEINNPLATISGRVQLLARQTDDPETAAAYDTIGAQALRVRDMIGDVMLFARPPEPKLERVDVASAMNDILADARFDFSPRAEIDIDADPGQFAIVLHELHRNAVTASPTGSSLEIALDIVNRFARITLRHSGVTLDAPTAAHLFDPFFSGHAAGRGLGFGLCKVWRITTMHGGGVTLKSDRGMIETTTYWPLSRCT